MLDFISDCWDAVYDNPVAALATGVGAVAAGAAVVAFARQSRQASAQQGFWVQRRASQPSALSNTSLAAIFGGALSTGGGGIAAGTTAIGSLGAKAGSTACKLATRSLSD